MLFEQESRSFRLLDVLFLDMGCSKNRNTGRDFDALSFRLEAASTIDTKDQHLSLSDNDITFIPAALEYTRTSKIDKLIVIHFKTMGFQGNRIEHFTPVDATDYRALFEEILSIWLQKPLGYRHECAGLLYRILAKLYRDHASQAPGYGKIEAAVRYIEQNCLKKDFSLAPAAASCFMSEVYFRQLFKKRFHMSPKQYVICYRIRHAASLILAGYFSLQEIADLCGFNDPKHFSTVFKRIMGVPPSRYSYHF